MRSGGWRGLRAESKPRGVTEEQLLQGPLSDAMAHVSQLLTLRRLAGALGELHVR